MVEDEEIEFFKSEGFKRKFRERVEEDTWEKGLPMVYIKDGKIVRHFADGRIEIVKEIEDKLVKVEQKQFKI
jgi:hypothetical protein